MAINLKSNSSQAERMTAVLGVLIGIYLVGVVWVGRQSWGDPVDVQISKGTNLMAAMLIGLLWPLLAGVFVVSLFLRPVVGWWQSPMQFDDASSHGSDAGQV